MKKIYLFLLTVLFCFPVFGQQNLDGRSVNRGKIYTTDYETIDGQYIVFSKDSLEYYLEQSQNRKVLGLNQITEVTEYNGHYGNTGIWIGAIAGAGIGLAVALGTEETETTGFIQTTTIQTWPIYLFTALGSLVGYALGSTSEDWDTVYSNNNAAILKNIYVKQNKRRGMMVSYNVYF